jgi:hypothetical protein
MKPHRRTADTPVRRHLPSPDKPQDRASAGPVLRRKARELTAAEVKAVQQRSAAGLLVSAEENRDHKRLTRRGEVDDHPIAAHWHRGPMIPQDASWKRRERPS